MSNLETTKRSILEEETVDVLTLSTTLEVKRTTIVRTARDEEESTTVKEEIVFSGKVPYRNRYSKNDYLSFHAVKPELVSLLATKGWPTDNSTKDEDRLTWSDFKSYLIEKGVMDHILYGYPYEILAFDFGNYEAFNDRLDYLPLATTFDYLHGMHNGNYDLNAVAKALKGKQNVKILESDDWRESSVGDNGVLSIPYYNAEPGRNQQLILRWYPTKEEYNLYKEEDNKRFDGKAPFQAGEMKAFSLMGLDKYRKVQEHE